MQPYDLASGTMILLVGLLAPIVCDQLARWVVVGPALVELLLGVVVGPTVLGWVHDTSLVRFFANIGLVMVLFMAGYELQPARTLGRPLRLAVGSWLASLALGVGAGLVLGEVAHRPSGLVIGLALTTTAVGIIAPLLQDLGEADTEFGVVAMASGVLGEFGPIVVVSLVFGTQSSWREALWLGLFSLLAVASVAASMAPVPAGVRRLVGATMNNSAQLIVRLGLLLLLALVWAADSFGLDVLLGAFAAGIAFRQFSRAAAPGDVERVDGKFDAIAHGLFIPFFFVVSGSRLQLSALAHTPGRLVLVPVVLVLFLVVRGLPTWWAARRTMTGRERVALGLLASTALPVVVVITSIGEGLGRIDAATAAAVVAAAALSVLVFPVLAIRVRAGRWRATPPGVTPVSPVDGSRRAVAPTPRPRRPRPAPRPRRTPVWSAPGRAMRRRLPPPP